MNKIALYPGTFDPPTNGHLDLVRRSLRVFSRVIVGIAYNPHKHTLFNPQERLEMFREAVKDMSGVEVDILDGLVIDYAQRHKVNAIIRGMRAVTDFEHELQIASVNRQLCPEIETVFMSPSEHYTYLSSSVVREVALFGGPVSEFVPEHIEKRLREKLANSSRAKDVNNITLL